MRVLFKLYTTCGASTLALTNDFTRPRFRDAGMRSSSFVAASLSLAMSRSPVTRKVGANLRARDPHGIEMRQEIGRFGGPPTPCLDP